MACDARLVQPDARTRVMRQMARHMANELGMHRIGGGGGGGGGRFGAGSGQNSGFSGTSCRRNHGGEPLDFIPCLSFCRSVPHRRCGCCVTLLYLGVKVLHMMT